MEHDDYPAGHHRPGAQWFNTQSFYHRSKLGDTMTDAEGVVLRYSVDGNNSPPGDIQTKLAQLYHDFGGPRTKSEIVEQCRDETVCPITMLNLNRLSHKKRLIRLDGRCYAFYAFIGSISIDKEPFTRQPWSPDAKTKIKLLRAYIPTLQMEYNEFSEMDTPTRTRRLGRTARRRTTLKNTKTSTLGGTKRRRKLRKWKKV